MGFSLNRIELIGNLGQDAETRFTNDNVSVTTFSIATTNSYKGKDGNWVNETTWYNCTSFNLPDFFKESLKKGKKFFVAGRLKKEEYTDKEGAKKQAVKVITSDIIPLDGKERGNVDHDEQHYNEPAPNAEPTTQNTVDDDLPF